MTRMKIYLHIGLVSSETFAKRIIEAANYIRPKAFIELDFEALLQQNELSIFEVCWEIVPYWDLDSIII